MPTPARPCWSRGPPRNRSISSPNPFGGSAALCGSLSRARHISLPRPRARPIVGSTLNEALVKLTSGRGRCDGIRVPQDWLCIRIDYSNCPSPQSTVAYGLIHAVSVPRRTADERLCRGSYTTVSKTASVVRQVSFRTSRIFPCMIFALPVALFEALFLPMIVRIVSRADAVISARILALKWACSSVG